MSNEVTNDLKSLADLELPSREEPLGRNLVKVTVFLFVLTIIASLTAVTYALIASIHREEVLQSEIRCIRQSAVILDQRISEGLAVLINNDSSLLEGLYGVAVEDPFILNQALKDIQDLIASGEVAKQNLDDAVEARQEALDEC